jgi:hypothetical protein
MIPNETARDTRLTFRARGVLTFLLSQREGWDITNADEIAEGGGEGREAVRKVVRELEGAGYVRRYQTRDESGRMVGHLDLYPYGDAPGTGNQSSVDRSPESRSPDSRALYKNTVEENQEETSSSSGSSLRSSPSSSGETTTTTTDDLVTPSNTPPFPLVAERRLASLSITGFDDWHAAWERVHAHNDTEPGVPYPPGDHLDGYLFDCRTNGHRPNPWKWEGFYRKRRLHESVAFTAQARAIQAREDWDEFEMRSNRMPPRTYGPPPEEPQ